MAKYYLIGMMGSGKTVTGKALAESMNMKFTDLDQVIERQTGARIAEIFKSQGEDQFRRIETEQLVKESQGDSFVMATGGGCPMKNENVKLMKAYGKVIYLKGSLNTLWDRVKGDLDRPLLHTHDPQETLKDLYDDRKKKYEGAADLFVDTDGKTAEKVAEEIIQLLEVE